MTATTDDIAATQREDERNIREAADAFRSLLSHPGWKLYLSLIEQVGENFHKSLMEPLGNSFECVKSEYAKGALTGLSLAAGLPSAKIKQADELRKTTDNEE